MLGGAVNDLPPQSNPPAQQQHHPSAVAAASSQLEAGTTTTTTTTTSTPPNKNISSASSTGTRSSTTPTPSAAPPSTSAAALDSAGPHHVPDYVSRQALENSSNRQQTPSSSADIKPSSSSSTPVASTVPQPSSMNPSSSSVSYAAFGHEPPASQPLRSTSSQQQQQHQELQGSNSTPASSRIRPTVHAEAPVGRSAANSPSRIKVRDLSHVQSFAKAEFHAQVQGEPEGPGQQRPADRQYEISSMPTTDIIEMVAGLLTKITATNDVHHNDMRIPPPDGTANLSPQATSVLAFHGKNVPAISILSYLTRINKYCPTTYEVFISLLIYFDRMTDLVNRGHLDRVRHHWGGYTVAEPGGKSNEQPTTSSKSSSEPGTKQPSHASPIVTPPSSTGMTAQDPASPSISPSLRPHSEGEAFSHFFVVDSYNIHRLVIAGVTCASKFFSDVFYTNSRYAKVGGLPLVELNHLELQFLLLNDFRLSIPVEELEAYGTMLVEFYAREMLSTQASSQDAPVQPPFNPPLASIRQPEVRQTPTPP